MGHLIWSTGSLLVLLASALREPPRSPATATCHPRRTGSPILPSLRWVALGKERRQRLLQGHSPENCSRVGVWVGSLCPQGMAQKESRNEGPQADAVVLRKELGLGWESWRMKYVHDLVTLPLDCKPREILPCINEGGCAQERLSPHYSR